MKMACNIATRPDMPNWFPYGNKTIEMNCWALKLEVVLKRPVGQGLGIENTKFKKGILDAFKTPFKLFFNVHLYVTRWQLFSTVCFDRLFA